MNESTSAIRLNRFKMLLVAAIFVLPFAAALIAFYSGWQPGTRSHGQPIEPQRNFTGIPVVLDSNGSNWLWRDPVEPRWTLVALSDGACGTTCVNNLILLRNARLTLGEHQKSLRLLYLGQPPTGQPGKVLAKTWHYGRDTTGALASFRPHQPGAVAVILVEVNGTALVRYPAGTNPDGIKDDLHKVMIRR